jgi:hypothetical protein
VRRRRAHALTGRPHAGPAAGRRGPASGGPRSRGVDGGRTRGRLPAGDRSPVSRALARSPRARARARHAGRVGRGPARDRQPSGV